MLKEMPSTEDAKKKLADLDAAMNTAIEAINEDTRKQKAATRKRFRAKMADWRKVLRAVESDPTVEAEKGGAE